MLSREDYRVHSDPYMQAFNPQIGGGSSFGGTPSPSTEIDLQNIPPLFNFNLPVDGTTEEPDPYNPQEGYGTYVDWTGKRKASDINAQIIRAEYEDYKRRFIPAENELMRLASSEEEKQKAVDSAEQSVIRGFDSSERQSNMTAERLGVGAPASMVGAERSNALAETAAIAQAKNDTRKQQEDLQLEIMTGIGNAGNQTRIGG